MLEKKLSEFFNSKASLVFSSGYHVNFAVASTLINRDTIILQDKLNHASLVDAALLSRGKLVRYQHKNLSHLKNLLAKHKTKDLIVMTDGVFSMDGDCAPLKEISKLCKRYQALLIVDDVFDTGNSIDQIIQDLKTACKKNTPEIRIATPFFKPSQNKTERKPDYYLHETDKWLVFPHELECLSSEEIIKNKPELKDLLDKITPKL